MEPGPDGGWLSATRDALRMPSAQFYALSDLTIAKRIGAALFFAAAGGVLILLPISPPDQSSIGDAGWLVAGLIVIAAVATGVRLHRHPSAIGPNELMAMSYEAIALIAALVWLAGPRTPYAELLLVSTLYAAATHPPRRVLVFLVAVAAALISPLVYGDWTKPVVSEEVGRFLIWSALALVATIYTARVRLQRAGLREESEAARTQARVDPLTGLGNRRAFDEALAAATARAKRSGAPLSVIVADLDSFKQVNDRHGLQAGDRCLREVASALEAAVRVPDSCFRWGGDEFVVLADIDRPGARALQARMQEVVEAGCRTPSGEPLSIHVGAAQMGEDGSDAEELLAAAGTALARAKGHPGGAANG